MIKTGSAQKEVSTKLTKGLLEPIILQYLNSHPMHGYQIIIQLRKDYGIYFGPSTIYPLLTSLEKKGYLQFEWDMKADRPRKIYHLTNNGQSILTITEDSLTLIIRKLTQSNNLEITADQPLINA